MRSVTRYADPITAGQAAAYLTAHGIIARSVVRVDAFNPGATVEIADPARLEAAQDLLQQFDLHKPEYLHPLEVQAVPDLAKLPRSVVPTCPACWAPLPLSAAIVHCPACDAAVNVVDRIVEQFGPEALEPCFPVDAYANFADLTDEQVSKMDFACPECQYSLAGLALAANCPECGRPFDKREMLNSGDVGSLPDAKAHRLTEEQVLRAPLQCPGCQYFLAGLSAAGACPGCGRPFDKRRMLNL